MYTIKEAVIVEGRYDKIKLTSFLDGIIYATGGFSVISTDLYSERRISIGALIAVYIATSDEAIPIMIAQVDAIPKMFLLIAVKIIMGISVGYLAIVLYDKIFKNNSNLVGQNSEAPKSTDGATASKSDDQKIAKEHHPVHGCCKHDIEQQKFDWIHPILHCLKISAFILIVNIVLGIIIYYVTEEKLIAFLEKSSSFQPLFAVIIGLIPNCASSVVLTQLYIEGSISFGSIIAGLSAGSGLGLVVLFKENKDIKENFKIMGGVYLIGVTVGIIFDLLGVVI